MIGILITNLGTPAEPTPQAVKGYLAEFLSDPYVVALPAFIWQPILRGIVLNTRPKKSAALYQKIWTQEGSPLLAITKKQAEKLKKLFDGNVVFAMRYGDPSLKAGLEQLKHCQKIIVLPLYPQYSITTTGSTIAAIHKILKTWQHAPTVKFIEQYAEEPDYITALTQQIKNYWQQNGRAEKLLFSFHGLPKNSIAKGDPYYYSCQKTVQLIAKELQLADNQWQLVFQSRFGAQKWLEPYCDLTLKALPKQGIKKVDIICPGFAADCLETLEEIAIRNKEIFLEAGGEQLNYIPALNDSDAHINFLADLIQRNL